MLTISDDCHKEVAVFQQHCTVAECFHQPLAAKSWPPLARGFKAGPWLSTARPRAIRPDAPARLSAAPAHPVVTAGKTSYWDERYTKDPEPFDWYQRYSGIQARRGAGMERVAARRRVFGHRRGRLARRPAAAPARPREPPPQELVQKYIKKDDSILMAGCGNSRLSEDMFEDGYANLSNIDISRVARRPRSRPARRRARRRARGGPRRRARRRRRRRRERHRARRRATRCGDAMWRGCRPVASVAKGRCGSFFYTKVICANKSTRENASLGVILEGAVETAEDEGVAGDVDGGELARGAVADLLVRGEVARGVDDDGTVVAGTGEEGAVG